MKRPVAVIASKNQKLRENIANVCDNLDCGIDFEVKTYEDREKLGNLPGSQVYVATSLNPDSNQQVLARKLRDENVGCARILVTTTKKLLEQHKRFQKASLISNYEAYQKEKKSEQVNWVDFKTWFRENYPTFHDIAIDGDSNPLQDEVQAAIERIRQRKLIIVPLSIGIVGLGKLGRQLCYDLKSKPFAKEVHAFTNWVKGDYDGSDIIPRLAFAENQRSKFTFHQRLEGLVEAMPDVLIISTGEYGIAYDGYHKIKDLTERLMQGAYPKVRTILQAIKDKDYNGTICMESNSTGALLQVAKRMGIDPSMLTSITPDMSRHKTLLLEKLLKKDPSLKYQDIDLIVIGEHGKEIPILREARVKGRLLTEVHPEFKDSLYRDAFILEAREIGLKGVKASEKLGDNYGGIPEIIINNLESFAHFQRRIPSAYSYFPEADCFIGAPSIVSYPLKIESEVKSLKDLSEDKEVRAELGRTIGYQIALTNRYHPKSQVK